MQENVPLAPLTTLRVGGPARYFVKAHSEAELREGAEWAQERSYPLLVLGGGSNLLIADRGFPGLVLQVAVRGFGERHEEGQAVFVGAAGEEWDSFVAAIVEKGYGGLECMSGIPGGVGGTPIQNVGAYGQEAAETICWVRALEIATGKVRKFSRAECGFAYRTSIFNTSARGQYIVLSVAFAVAKVPPRIEYADLKKYFAGRSDPTLLEVRQAVREIRRGKGMLLVEGDSDCRSAGSFFKNPIVSEAEYNAVSERAATLGATVPRFASGSAWKLSAAWLVEHSGLQRGYRKGAAGISSKHALAIVNLGGATASEIVALKNEIQQRVADSFGVQLQPEPIFVGF